MIGQIALVLRQVSATTTTTSDQIIWQKAAQPPQSKTGSSFSDISLIDLIQENQSPSLYMQPLRSYKLLQVTAVHHVGFFKDQEIRSGRPICVTVQNFVEIGQTVSEISRFIDFSIMAALRHLDLLDAYSDNPRGVADLSVFIAVQIWLEPRVGGIVSKIWRL